MVFFLVLLAKALAWSFLFASGTRSDLKGMLGRAALITVILTAMDRFTVIANLRFSAVVLTFALYAAMSFVLLPLAWKAKSTAVSVSLNVAGILGAFAGVNFTMDLLRGLFPFLNK